MTNAKVNAMPGSFVDTMPLGFESARNAMANGISPSTIVAQSFDRARRVLGEGVFISLASEDEALRRVDELVHRSRSGQSLPLLGLTFAVKDNIHVEGMITTAGCPALAIMPAETAACVTALEAAGAVLVGKCSLDQLANGLNGTRTAEPLCRNAINPEFIPGGSSSGSAVAVARDIVSFSLGSDTGGSGRVPAACNGIVGLKPTLGLVSMRGLLYNSRFFDCVPVFAQTTAEAFEVLKTIAGHDPLDPFSRQDASAIQLNPANRSGQPWAVPRESQLEFCGDLAAERAHEKNLRSLVDAGYSLREIDFAFFAKARRFIFQSPMVAERLVEYGDLIANSRSDLHPAVRAALEPAEHYSARDAFVALYEVFRMRREAIGILAEYEGLVVPTVPTIFTIAAMLQEPIKRNSMMGTYTYFANPLDLCAISVPGAAREDDLPSALCFLAPAGRDGVIRRVAEDFEVACAGRRPVD